MCRFLLISALSISVVHGNPGFCSADELTVEGTDAVEFSLIGEDLLDLVQPYENNGFTQQIKRKQEGGSVLVTSAPVPLYVTSPFTLHADLELPDLKTEQESYRAEDMSVITRLIAKELLPRLQKTDSMSKALSLIMKWCREKINVERSRQGASNLVAAIDRGSGNCVDICNLAEFILGRLGIQHRRVHGIVFLEDNPGECAESRLKPAFHRWLEIYIPSSGWLFYDPSASLGFVSADYIVLFISDSSLIPPKTIDEQDYQRHLESLTIRKRSRNLYVTDCRAEKQEILTRRFSTHQMTAAFFGQITDSSGTLTCPSWIVIRDRDSRAFQFEIDYSGRYAAYCLASGDYQILLKTPETTLEIGVISLTGGEVFRRDYHVQMKSDP